MTKKSVVSKTYGEPFLTKLIARSKRPILTENGERYRCAIMLNDKLTLVWNINKPSTPIGEDCVVEPVTIGDKMFYNIM